MLNEHTKSQSSSMAEIAGGRAMMYGLFVEVFGHLPDQRLLAKIKNDDFNTILIGVGNLDNQSLQSYRDHIKSYQSLIKSRTNEQVLTELSVDRTRILRGTGYGDLKPPYEGLYRGMKEIGDSVLAVKRFYRKAGLLPDETVHESPDYLCVELDFMKQLCLREQAQWSSGADVTETVMTEAAFLREHLGCWVGEFCCQAEKEAMTRFYKGFIGIMDAVVIIDNEYLQDLLQGLTT